MKAARVAGWTAGVALAVAALLFLDFYLPATDVVRIVDTDVKRMDDTGVERDGGGTRDVRFINAVQPDGSLRVYRNEETGWGFPWYFKFDSGNLQTRAQDARSTQESPRWVAITHYGWRFELLSSFPNAVSIEPVDGPKDSPLPLFRIVFALCLVALGGAGWWWLRRWQRRRAARIGTSRQVVAED